MGPKKYSNYDKEKLEFLPMEWKTPSSKIHLESKNHK